MWSALSISSPPPDDSTTVVDCSVGDSFFEELLNDCQLTQAKNKEKEKSEECFEKITAQASDESEAGWEVEGWEVSTPISKPIRPISNCQKTRIPSSLIEKRQQLVIKETTNAVMNELREYMLNFADPRATVELNEDLNEKSFSSLMAYYLPKPELADYTVDHEVSRMCYDVCCADGQTVSCGPGTKGQEGVIRALRTVINNEDINSTTHLLIRMANQSLLADFISALHDYLIKPQLQTAVVVGDVSFRLDLENLLLVCDAIFEVSTQGGLNTDRILLGTLPASITVAAGLSQDLVYEFKRPSLRVVLDDELWRAASAIALQRLEESAMISIDDTDPPTDGDGRGASTGIFGMVGFGSAGKEDRQVTTPVKTSSSIRLYNLETPPKTS